MLSIIKIQARALPLRIKTRNLFQKTTPVPDPNVAALKNDHETQTNELSREKVDAYRAILAAPYRSLRRSQIVWLRKF